MLFGPFVINPFNGKISLDHTEEIPLRWQGRYIGWNDLSELDFEFTGKLHELLKSLNWPQELLELAQQCGARLTELDFRPGNLRKNMEFMLKRVQELVVYPPMLRHKAFEQYRAEFLNKHYSAVQARRESRTMLLIKLPYSVAPMTRVHNHEDPFGGEWAIHAVTLDRHDTLILAASSGLTTSMGRLSWWGLPPQDRGAQVLPGYWQDLDDESYVGRSDWSFWLNPSIDLVHVNTSPYGALNIHRHLSQPLPNAPKMRTWELYVDRNFAENFTIEAGLLSQLEWNGKPQPLAAGTDE